MLAIALLFAVVPAEADPPFSADGIVLCDFDDAASLAQWSPRDLTTLELTDDWSSGGSAALAFAICVGTALAVAIRGYRALDEISLHTRRNDG